VPVLVNSELPQKPCNTRRLHYPQKCPVLCPGRRSFLRERGFHGVRNFRGFRGPVPVSCLSFHTLAIFVSPTSCSDRSVSTPTRHSRPPAVVSGDEWVGPYVLWSPGTCPITISYAEDSPASPCDSSSRFRQRVCLVDRVRSLVHMASHLPIFSLLTTPTKVIPHVLIQSLESTPSSRQVFPQVLRSSQRRIWWGRV